VPPAFTSWSFQASKILALGEGGVLVTNDPDLAARARSISSLGYALPAGSSRIDPAAIKHPDYQRHHVYPCINARMNDVTAGWGISRLYRADALKADRRQAASYYREAIAGCAWITPQFVPEGWTHDYWCYAVALDSADLWHPFVDAVVRHGGERPYAAWRLTYQEPAFRHLAADGCCPVAESLQPRLVQFQTNNLASAEKNAEAARHAIREIGG
jgi:perosamine synthetase